MSILLTGGTGYIGSHTAIELLNAGEEIVIVDNLSNSKIEMVDKIKKLSGKDLKFYETDILDREGLEKVFSENEISEVIHFAGFKAVGESCQKPIEYYHNNVTGTLILLDVMRKHNCKKIVFSSSATVYGSPKSLPIRENFPLSTTNPYGTTKLMIEKILEDVAKADSEWSIEILRYFNPIGAHESGEIGENPNGIPNNLMPYINYVAVGKLDHLNVFGNDYDTHDGTGVRDYIHVVDLALGHLKALSKARETAGINYYNLGTGKGYSVLDIVDAFEKANGIKIKYEIAARRPGDIASCYADPSKAREELGWEATRDLQKMCEDSWRFVRNEYGKSM
ncbi:MAG: UDP-glucose 4-epimerase GalE [Clostridia bacterium]|nr:UDP-glucose 4-epimerase GalE [Clostridia bacterium]